MMRFAFVLLCSREWRDGDDCCVLVPPPSVLVSEIGLVVGVGRSRKLWWRAL
jgi:hypothetical protein